jgi:hypothetical protein
VVAPTPAAPPAPAPKPEAKKPGFFARLFGLGS